MVVVFTNTYAISVYHHWCCEFESRLGRGVQHYVINFVCDLWQVSGFLRVLRYEKFSNMSWFGFMVFNATFNNISVISWRSVLLVEENGGPGENHWPVASHWQTLSHNVVHLALVDALDSQSQVIKITSCLPMVGGSLQVLWLIPPLKLVAMILLKYCWKWR
jgi:hypothetical protein